jgi:Ca2+-binding RTX toxin-like protein
LEDGAQPRAGGDQDEENGDDFPGGGESYNASAVNRIVASLCGGDDQFQIAGNVEHLASINGGAGDDSIKGGAGPAILFGGEGSDVLNAGSARSILIGGAGLDRLVGGASDDILIAGWTTFEAHSDALLAILAEWNSERPYTTRVTNIVGLGDGPRLNDSFYLQRGKTVEDDNNKDTLTGAAGSDWFFAVKEQDQLTDRKSNEQLS